MTGCQVTVSDAYIKIPKIIFGWVPMWGWINTTAIRLRDTGIVKNSLGL
jgi:hypothetical protein